MTQAQELIKIQRDAHEIKVVDKRSSEVASKFVVLIKEKIKLVSDKLDPQIKNAHKTWKDLNALKSEQLAPLEQAESFLKNKIKAYLIEEQEKINAENRRNREEAQRAEDKRKKELESQAKTWEAKGNAEKAEERRQMAEMTFVPAPIAREIDKPKSSSMQDNWTFEIINEAVLPREFLRPDEIKIRQFVKTMKAEAKIEGVRVFNDPIIKSIR